MEVIKPEIKVVKQKPPAEPPPSLELTYEEEEQWLEDVQTPAKIQLHKDTKARIAILQTRTYHPQATSQINNADSHNHMLQNMIHTSYLTKHPQIHQLMIPAPKFSTHIESQYENSNWMDNESIEWVQDNDMWKVKTLQTNLNKEKINPTEKWEAMIKGHSKRDKIKKLNPCIDSTKIQICTDKVQSDTGANQAVTNNKDSLYAYSDIEAYPIGGVKADEVAIVCTGHGLRPWQSQEGKVIMVKTMYCKDVDGTIISPTTVVQQNEDQYHGFSIESDCDKGRGTLTLKNRDGKNYATYTMALENGLWFHNHDNSKDITSSVKRMNMACYNNVWHGRLGHAGDSITTQIHNHVKGIKKTNKSHTSIQMPIMFTKQDEQGFTQTNGKIPLSNKECGTNTSPTNCSC